MTGKNSALAISFEVFPPKSDAGAAKLWATVQQLSHWEPEFISVTCGASGSAIEGTGAVVHHIHQQFGIALAPHIAIARQSRTKIRAVLKDYKAAGINRIVAIRGDPSQTHDEMAAGDTYPNTVDFVAELKSEFGLEPLVAAYPDVHPRALSPQQDLDHLKRKVDAGATLAISQFFFQAETFLRFRDKMQAAGINVPLAAGIMPIHNLAQTVNFANGCGTIVPDGFAERFDRHNGHAISLFKEGVAHGIELCEMLRHEGVSHFHFYTLNRCEMTAAICDKLTLGSNK